MTMPFEVHPQLAADCHLLGCFDLSVVLLHRNGALPWFILVPQTTLADLLDLDPKNRQLVVEEAALISKYLKEELSYPKVNFAAIGNVVPQMHVHVIGRSPDDACWPAPVWGHLQTDTAYEPSFPETVATTLTQHYGMHPA
jgi:diadenosine tetraphosphate (Ap4A) HIT family hydrolase